MLGATHEPSEAASLILEQKQLTKADQAAYELAVSLSYL